LQKISGKRAHLQPFCILSHLKLADYLMDIPVEHAWQIIDGKVYAMIGYPALRVIVSPDFR
jgi:hypothetical protein